MNRLQKYFNYRQALIDQYIKGDMTKSEYLTENFNAVMDLGIKPFKRIDNLDKALFNYQYYNAMAKEAKMQAYNAKYPEQEKLYFEKLNYYYNRKDYATLKILEILDYKNIDAYFIRVRSKVLKGKLFEIVIKDCENMILHCSSDLVLKRLREENVFDETVKKSLIDDYINQKY